MRKEVPTFTDDRDDLRGGATFLGALLAIPVAGLLGLPLLILLLLLFLANPGNLGQRLGQCQLLKSIPGFRSGDRRCMVAASLLYLLPLSLLGIVVVSVDSMLLRVLLG
ncbi:MAG TPA: hypothetical protein VFV38_40645 [Ktedonobacteraceae bacterium]|nr:hypothetical protein [Ktedonobacteraceae bacterium]